MMHFARSEEISLNDNLESQKTTALNVISIASIVVAVPFSLFLAHIVRRRRETRFLFANPLM